MSQTKPETKRTWDDVWAVPDGWYPNEFVVRFLARYVRKRSGLDSWTVHRPDLTRALDLGCGPGRHVIMLGMQGFEAAGIDISRIGVEFARRWAEAEGVRADLRVGSATELPWGEGAFDLVISDGVLDHMTPADAGRAVEEVKRVLRPGGLFYLSLISTEEFSYGSGVAVGPDTFVITEGAETGLVQRYFRLGDVGELLGPAFEVMDVVCSEWFPVQGKGFSALAVEKVGKLSRFHVAARRIGGGG